MANFSSHFYPVSVTLVNMFGDAAVKNVGVTQFTVAAGDDYRILAGYNAYTTYTQNSATWTPTIKKFDYVDIGSSVIYTYSGIAKSGTNEAINEWTIKRIAYTTTSTVSNIKVAYNTSWHGRLTAAYV